MTKHLLVCISPHGYGHTAQTAPVINALRRSLPDLRLTLRTTVPHALLAARFEGAFTQVPCASDFGMKMVSAMQVLAEESAVAYADFHAHWDNKVKQEAAELRALAPDLVLTNVPYLPLAGAAVAGIPSAALCSLNWMDIYQHYCGERPEAGRILEQTRAAYNSAALFLRPQPSMPMPVLTNTRAIGPIARVGRNRRDEINSILKLAGDETLVLVAPGGIPTRWPMEHWPRLPGVRWIVQSDWHVTHPDAVALEILNMSITDVMRSDVVLLGKPGYGSVAECVCNDTPMLYLMRHDWPEEPYLLEWLHRYGRGLPVDSGAVQTGELSAVLEELLAQPAKPTIAPSGIQEAAEHLKGLLL